MKNRIIVLLTLSIGLMSACKKNEPKPPTTNDTSAPISASELFSLRENGILRNVSLHYAEVVNHVISLQAKITDEIYYGMLIHDSLTPETYPMIDDGVAEINHTGDSFSSFYHTESGSITITAHDQENKIIRGTFNCIIKKEGSTQTKTITLGQFDFDY